MPTFEAQKPPYSRTNEQSDGGEGRGKAQGGERCAGEIEEVGHGEGVVAYAAVGEQGANVVHEWQVARVPESPGEGCGDEDANDGEDSLRTGEPPGGEQGLGRACAAGQAVFGSAAFFSACEDGGDEDEERRPDGEGVVLLIG